MTTCKHHFLRVVDECIVLGEPYVQACARCDKVIVTWDYKEIGQIRIDV